MLRDRLEQRGSGGIQIALRVMLDHVASDHGVVRFAGDQAFGGGSVRTQFRCDRFRVTHGLAEIPALDRAPQLVEEGGVADDAVAQLVLNVVSALLDGVHGSFVVRLPLPVARPGGPSPESFGDGLCDGV